MTPFGRIVGRTVLPSALYLLWRLSRGYRLTPWRSPYLRWRMETYWGLHADRIGFTDFWTFLWRHRTDTLRYLRWANSVHAGPARPIIK